MLTKFSLRNFKSWEVIKNMRLAPITGLFGTNSSGKTSLIQFFLMLKQTVDSPDRTQVLNLGDERSLVSLGTFRDVMHQHIKSGQLICKFSWTLPKELKIRDPEQRSVMLFTGGEMEFAVEITENGSGRMIVNRLDYSFGGHTFGLKRKSEKEGKYELSSRPDTFRFQRTRGRPWDLPAPVKCYGFPDQVKAYYQNAGFLADFELAFEQMFSRIYYLGPYLVHEPVKGNNGFEISEEIDLTMKGGNLDYSSPLLSKQVAHIPFPRRRPSSHKVILKSFRIEPSCEQSNVNGRASYVEPGNYPKDLDFLIFLLIFAPIPRTS